MRNFTSLSLIIPKIQQYQFWNFLYAYPASFKLQGMQFPVNREMVKKPPSSCPAGQGNQKSIKTPRKTDPLLYRPIMLPISLCIQKEVCVFVCVWVWYWSFIYANFGPAYWTFRPAGDKRETRFMPLLFLFLSIRVQYDANVFCPAELHQLFFNQGAINLLRMFV